MVYIHNGISFSLKKEGNPVICKNIDETGGYYVKWKKPDKAKYCMVSIICGILKSRTQRE